MKKDIFILYAEDDAPLRNSVINYLSIYHKISAAESFAQATALMKDKSYDVLLVDLDLGDGNGIDLIAEFKIRNPESAIIVITGESDFHSVSLSIESGADDYIVKSGRLVLDILARIPISLAHSKAKFNSIKADSKIILTLPSHVEDINEETYNAFLKRCEKEYLRKAFYLCHGQLEKLSQRLGISRSTMFRKANAFNLTQTKIPIPGNRND